MNDAVSAVAAGEQVINDGRRQGGKPRLEIVRRQTREVNDPDARLERPELLPGEAFVLLVAGFGAADDEDAPDVGRSWRAIASVLLKFRSETTPVELGMRRTPGEPENTQPACRQTMRCDCRRRTPGRHPESPR